MLNLFRPLTFARSRRPIVHASGGHLRVGQYAARVFPRKMACRPVAVALDCGSRPSTRARGLLGCCPFSLANGIAINAR
jgi:hypothetical protein